MTNTQTIKLNDRNPSVILCISINKLSEQIYNISYTLMPCIQYQL